MTDRDPLPPSLNEQAAWWHQRALQGMAPDEMVALDAWLAADAANRRAFQKAGAVWEALEGLRDSPELISRRSDALEALRRLNRRRWTRPSGGVVRWWPAGAAAAGLVFAAGLGYRLTPIDTAQPTRYATSIGERQALAMSDGSRLSLDSSTRLFVDLKRDWRKVTLLAGRARFDVAKDANRPFTVTAGDRTVVATGTSFSVELLNGSAHVIVYEGSVAVSRGAIDSAADALAIKRQAVGNAATLTPARELVVPAVGDGAARVTTADLGRAAAWETGQLDFVDQPLSQAAEQLNRYSTTKIEIAGDAASDIRVNGVFNAGSSEAFATAVAGIYRLRITREPNRIILSKAIRP